MKKYLLMIVLLVGFTGMAMAQHRPVKHHRHHPRHHRHVVHHRPH